jgi:hypothetical protein
MARQLIENKLELNTEDVLAALHAAGWPIPDVVNDPQAPPVNLLQDGARWAIAWTETVDDIVPGP